MALRVLHADEAVLVIDKPSGLLSVPGRGEDRQDCVSRRIQRLWADARVVHRLDMDTSGLMIMARGPSAQRRLSDAFAAQSIEKRYVAVVHGAMDASLAAASGWQEIDLPIAADWLRRPLRVIDRQGGKPSLTRWRCLATDTAAQRTRLELSPQTGRTHQLRVHLQAMGHPIVGDRLYGSNADGAEGRLHLHASRLQFTHPMSGHELTFGSPVPF
ncbi:MAG: RluA family pseudouridine synthase [Rhodoferax sp.]|nr:RluA family pseudouridine synthase [Rhodoferax sp.]